MKFKMTIFAVLFGLCIVPLLKSQDIDENTPPLNLGDEKELNEALTKWRKQFVRHIMTEREKAEWGNLKTPAEKLAFIEYFWMLRDPDPSTPENEFRQEYLERWQYVMKNFTSGKPGWRTDRGKIYLMLGPPTDVERNAFGRDRTERPSEIWYYNSINNERLPAQIDVQFVDFMGYGDYEIVTSIDRTARFNSRFGISMNALDAYALRRPGEINVEEGPEDIISSMWDEANLRDATALSRGLFDLQQELQEIERTPLLLARSPNARIRTEIARGDLTFSMSSGSFKAEDNKVFVPVTLAIPLQNVSYTEDENGRYYSVAIYARIHGGDFFNTYEEDLKVLLKNNEDSEDESERLRYLYQFWFTVPPGNYDIDVTLRDPLAKSVGHEESKVSIPEFKATEMRLSDIIIADLVGPAPQNELLNENEARPFQFANRRVIPNVARRVTVDQEFFYLYYHIYNFQLDDGSGRPNLKIQYFLYRNGTLFSKTPPSPLTNAYQNRASVETKFTTSAFGVGSYKIVAQVTDEISASIVKGEIEFEVVPREFRISQQ